MARDEDNSGAAPLLPCLCPACGRFALKAVALDAEARTNPNSLKAWR